MNVCRSSCTSVVPTRVLFFWSQFSVWIPLCLWASISESEILHICWCQDYVQDAFWLQPYVALILEAQRQYADCGLFMFCQLTRMQRDCVYLLSVHAVLYDLRLTVLIANSRQCPFLPIKLQQEKCVPSTFPGDFYNDSIDEICQYVSIFIHFYWLQSLWTPATVFFDRVWKKPEYRSPGMMSSDDF